MKTQDCVYLALDHMTFAAATQITSRLCDRIAGVKIHDFYDRYTGKIITVLKEMGARTVWVDAKLHDIPETVRTRVAALAEHGADIVSVHASGGVEMMQAAKDSATAIYAVSVLTSLTPEQCLKIYGSPPQEAVTRFAVMAQEAQVDGIVCSPQEVAYLSWYNADIVVPGTRSPGVAAHDQKRVDTPANALRSGATKLIIGRQITQAANPLTAIDALEHELAEAMAV